MLIFSVGLLLIALVLYVMQQDQPSKVEHVYYLHETQLLTVSATQFKTHPEHSTYLGEL